MALAAHNLCNLRAFYAIFVTIISGYKAHPHTRVCVGVCVYVHTHADEHVFVQHLYANCEQPLRQQP